MRGFQVDYKPYFIALVEYNDMRVGLACHASHLCISKKPGELMSPTLPRRWGLAENKEVWVQVALGIAAAGRENHVVAI